MGREADGGGGAAAVVGSGGRPSEARPMVGKASPPPSAARWAPSGSAAPWAPSGPAAGSEATADTAAAHTLNSGIREAGSSASLVSWLAPTQWNGRKTVSGRIDVLTRAGADIAPRRVLTRTESPARTPSREATIGCSSTNGPSSPSSRIRRVWAPDWYCASTRPVVRCKGYSPHGCSAGPRWLTAWNRARPSGVANRSRNIRSVPGWSGEGHGQKTPFSAATRAWVMPA